MKQQLIEQLKRLAMGRVDAAEALADLLMPKPAKAAKGAAPADEPAAEAEPVAEPAAEAAAAVPVKTTKAKKKAA
jgi:hypothetical protein